MRVHPYAGWFWSEAGYGNFRCRVVQLCSFGGCSPPQGTSTSPRRASGHSSVLSTLLECGALQLPCLFMVVLKYWSRLFCIGPRDCGWKWLLLSLVLHPMDLKGEGGEGGMMPLQQQGWEQPSLRAWATLGWPSWEIPGLPGCTKRY